MVKIYNFLCTEAKTIREKVFMEEQGFKNEFDDTNALFSNGENIEIKGLKEGLSYVIDVTMGQITSIEFSTYNEKWDGKISEFKIVKLE